MNKLHQIIGFIIQLHGGKIFTKIRLVKLLYLLDREFFRKHGRTLTGITYKSYFYGPYSQEIDAALQDLKRMGYITLELKDNIFNGKSYFVLTQNAPVPLTLLSDEEKREIVEFLGHYIDKPLDDIIDEVYTSKEYLNTSFGEVIKFKS